MVARRALIEILHGMWLGSWRSLVLVYPIPRWDDGMMGRAATVQFFPRASERRVLLIVEVCYTSSYVHMFTCSNLHIFTSSLLLLLSFSLSLSRSLPPLALCHGLSLLLFLLSL